MGKFWSLLFLLVPILGTGLFVVAAADLAPLQGHWLPEDVSTHGHAIDSLWDFILYLTGVIFIITGLLLFWFLWRYDAASNADPVKFTHGSHTLEVCWSVLPTVILLFIAIHQMNVWADAKLRRPTDPGQDGRVGTMDDPMLPGADGQLGTDDDVAQFKPALCKVTGRQFEWRLQYSGPDRELGTSDDLFLVNDLHVPVDEDVVLLITSEDVLHSFFLPNMRVKQDVVPGMSQYAWFKAKQSGSYDIVCAELCGWGHYKMKGRLTVESRDEFDAWYQRKYQEQETSEFTAQAGD